MELKLKIIKKCIISQDWIKWLNDKDVTKYSDNRLKKHSKSSQREFLKKKLKDKTCLLYKIIYEKKPIGIIEISKINNFHKTCEFTYMIGEKEYWNKGIGTKFIALALKIAFNKLSMVKVNVSIYGNNKASAKILMKNSFKREGKLRNVFKISKSKRVDRILFGITKKEFKLIKN